MKEVAAGSTATTSNCTNSGSACSVALVFHLAGVRRCTPDECEDEVSNKYTKKFSCLAIFSLIKQQCFCGGCL